MIKTVKILLVVVAATLVGCLKNDIPYARIQANIVDIAAEGQSEPARIDTINRIVNFYFPEDVDIANVRLSQYRLAADVVDVGDSLSMVLDMTEPLTVTLRIYQDYQWTLIANQTIKRYFTFANQIGTSTIDVPGHRVVAYINKKIDITAVPVESCKLAPEGWNETPSLAGQTVDFSHPVEVTVDYYGTPQVWTIYVEPTDAAVTTVSADAGTNVAWVYGECEVGREVGVEYRIQGETQWTAAPASWLEIDGGSFRAVLRHLSPGATYETRAVSGDEAGAVLTFTTGHNAQVPNSNFESWWLNGKIWCPWAEGSDPYWGTGNKGATTLGPSNTVPTEDTPSGSGLAAMLQTKFVGIGLLGKLAAGNIFVGDYVRTDGTNGILSFGRTFESRPTRVRGYLKYKTAPISSTTAGFEDLKGRPDTCIIWCALIDQDTPFEIRTNPNNRQLFDENGSYVVAYGKIEIGEDVNQYIPFEFKLDYKSTSRRPKYILVTASSSKFGDYFTGGDGAVLWVDDIELLYDYD